MKLTKYQHACFTIENEGQLLVVDPGSFSTDFIAPDHVAAIVITHEHGDHFDPEQIAAIMKKNPEAVIIAPGSVASKIEAFEVRAASAGDTMSIGVFDLAFFGGQHAVIHADTPVVGNIGLMINDMLYYPGDSFVLPNVPVDTLAVPASAPWMKISEAMDFMVAVHPRLAFPTHDAILSAPGKMIADNWLSGIASKNDIEYLRLDQTIEI